MLATILFSITACQNQSNNATNDPSNNNPDDPVITQELTPDQTKEKLFGIANQFIGKFNTEDQRAAIQLADGLYEKYETYRWEDFEDYGENRYDYIFNLPRYVKEVVLGKRVPSSMDNRIYIYSFAGESVIFEADENTRTWKNRGASSDNSIILRFTDKNGIQCEAKCWGEGQTKTYSYSWDHYTTPKVYATSSTNLEYHGDGEYDGEWRYFYYDSDNGLWYYINYDDYDYNTGSYRKIYVNESYVTYRYAYDPDNYQSYSYEAETGRYYYYDYANKYVDGTRTIEAVVPAKIFFTLKQGNTEIIRTELEQDMQKNHHATFSLMAQVVNLRWTTDINIRSTSGSFAYAFFYGTERLMSVAANLPSYQLIDKLDSQDYEDWIEQYEDRYDELLKKIGNADAMVDILNSVQAKIKINNFGYAYRDYLNWDDNYGTSTKEGCDRLCVVINENQTNGIYYNSDTKQAEFRAQTTQNRYGNYDVESVLYFPQDSTTYAIEEYFDRKPFTDLQYSIEDLANAYIRLSQLLFDEVGEVSF